MGWRILKGEKEMQKLRPFLDLLFYFDPKNLFNNNRYEGHKHISGNLCLCVCVCKYFSVEEKFMTQVTMDHLKVTSPKLFVAGNQVQFLHLLSFLIKSLTFNYYIGYLKTIL